MNGQLGATEEISPMFQKINFKNMKPTLHNTGSMNSFATAADSGIVYIPQTCFNAFQSSETPTFLDD
jgi:hypothetical protein